ncbi:MAG: allantoinase AllB [Thermoanaerobaculales bacterium]|jgi:allantoinase|nr:allantoinase AllB [Thermoanaerobaculales bacterium]
MRTRFINLRIPADGNRTQPAELVVEDGRFEEILPAGGATAAGGEHWVDLEGALVLPGVIDAHVHFDDPGYTHREDFATGTRAAAAGGVTCVADMPCTSQPPVTSIAALTSKLRAVRPKALVDYVLWGGVSANSIAAPDWRESLANLVDAGVGAIKVYLLSGMESFRDLDAGALREVLGHAHRLGVPVGVHAEDRAVVDELTARAHLHGEDSPAAYAASRPAAAESAAVATCIDACRATGARLHVVHLGTGEALDLLSAARLEGLPISAETCPHFLEFTDEDFDRLGSVLKTAPVVKTRADRERLWQGLAGGELSFVASDHAAGVWPDEKETGSIWSDYGGVPGVELLLPYLFDRGVRSGRLSLQRLTEVTAAEPARLFGIEHRKGGLRPGCDADFVVFDERARWTVRASGLHNLNRYTPLEGLELTGRVRATYLRGRPVFERLPDDDERFAEAGLGRWVRRGVA